MAHERPAEALSQAAEGEDRGAVLRALRAALARDYEAAEPGQRAQIAARLMDCLDKIAALPAPKEGTALDELAKRRAKSGTTARAARARRG